MAIELVPNEMGRAFLRGYGEGIDALTKSVIDYFENEIHECQLANRDTASLESALSDHIEVIRNIAKNMKPTADEGK